MHLVIGALVTLALLYLVFGRGSRRQEPEAAAPASRFEREVSEEDYHDMVVRNSERVPVLVDFYADWCAPCRAFGPVLSEMAQAYDGGFLLAKVNFDRNQSLAAECGIEALPTVLLVDGGKVVKRFTGGRLPHTIRFMLAERGIFEPGEAPTG